MKRNDNSQIVAFVEQLSHTLRSPLGVALGVLSDLAQGYELSAEEIRDGEKAARVMLARLNEITARAQTLSYDNSIENDSELLKMMIECVRI